MFRGALELGSNCICEPGAVKWVQVWFSDCVYTPWELLAFFVGVSSVFFWMIAQLPQFLSNILRQSADALSPWFLFQWLAGDLLNLLGCVLTGDQLATETFTAYYFIFADCVIISQYLYYQVRNQDRGYYSDESLHKPSYGYQTAIRIHPDPALENATARGTAVSFSSDSNGTREHQRQDSSMHKQLPRKDGYLEQLVAHLHSVQQQEFGVMARGERFQDFEEEKLQHLKYQVSLPRGRQSAPTCHFRRHLRRIVMEYNLEYGPPSVSRLTTQHALRLSKIDLKHSNGNHTSKSRTNLKKALCMAGLVPVGISGRNHLVGASKLPQDETVWSSRKLLMLCSPSKKRLLWVKETGTIFGWASSGLYLGSRISQLIKNNQRKSAEGLSLAMVSCAVLANLTYGSAILMRAKSWEDLIGKGPWLLGSLGTVSLDITLFLQAQYLSCRYSGKGVPNERTPLLLA